MRKETIKAFKTVFTDILLLGEALAYTDHPGRSFNLDSVFSSGASLSTSLYGGCISKSIESIRLPIVIKVGKVRQDMRGNSGRKC
jgi:hypothetical protein